MEETKANVGPYLKLYQVHSATFDSGILTNTAVHEAMHNCRVKNGWKIGLSVSGPNQDELIKEALKIRVGQPPKNPVRLFDSVQCTYNILEQRPAEALMEAHSAGVDIIIKEGLANGRALRHPKLLELAQTLACQPDQLALGAILSQPFRPRVLSGAVTAEQLSSNFGALYPTSKGVEEKLKATEGEAVLDTLMKESRMESERYWSDRSALKWN